MLKESLAKEELLEKFKQTRIKTELICKPLAIEDYSVQPIDDVSPPKWHLAHSTWFLEAFVLEKQVPNYQSYSADFSYLFNSYYNNAGDRVLRPNRGLMTRPTVEEVYDYRQYVTKAVTDLVDKGVNTEVLKLLEIGINHEQQHQELLAYDIKYILGNQPSFPSYPFSRLLTKAVADLTYHSIGEGLYEIGHQADGFCFDNELAAHKVYLQPFQIANRLTTNREYLEFMEAGGYGDFNLWHAEGWDFIHKHQIKAPLYWHKQHDKWHYYDCTGLRKIDLDLPVMHISYYEAFAFAAWRGRRLPTEFEWEVASGELEWGELWEWTGSAYLPYPGFEKAPGALGEYNGKFMVNQHVLRGASIATSVSHSRHTYRNFFHPSMRWMFSGIRLAI